MKRRKLSPDYNLQVINPTLAKEWHPSKNGKLTPKDVTPRSQRTVWWICKQGHEYTRSVGNKFNGDRCPYCKGKKVCKDNCLQTRNPLLAEEWHPTKNGALTPKDVVPHSNKKAWWKCKGGHEWEAVVASRSAGCGCPYCAGQRVTKEASLAAQNPILSKEWHPFKNVNLTPADVMLGSHKSVWWVCKKGHEWQAIVKSRGQGRGCPYCCGQRLHKDNCLSSRNPKLAREWHPTKNGSLTPEDVTQSTARKVWWQCTNGHEWEATLNSRSRGTGCPYCHSRTSIMELRIYTELKYIFPDTRFREKIDNVESDIYIPSLKVGIEHDGEYWHRNRYKKDNLKNITLEKKGIKLIRVRELGLDKIAENDIIYDYRKHNDKQLVDRLLKEIAKLSVISSFAQARVDWYLKQIRFANNKEFIDLLDMLPSPLLGSSFADQNPKLVQEWHPSKNGKLTPNHVGPGSKKKVWWQCKNGHEWEATVGHRSNGTGCPYCYGQRRASNKRKLQYCYSRRRASSKKQLQFGWNLGGAILNSQTFP